MSLNEMNLIIQKINSLNDKVITKKQLENIIKLFSPNSVQKKLENLRKVRKIKYYFLNYYYILNEEERKTKKLKYTTEEIVAAILNKSKIPWYFAFNTALERNNVIWQSYKTITILNDRISKKIILDKIQFHFIKTQKKYIFSFRVVKTKNRISTFYPTNEKIFIDYIYFRKNPPLELKNSIKKTPIKKILIQYPQLIQKKIENELK